MIHNPIGVLRLTRCDINCLREDVLAAFRRLLCDLKHMGLRGKGGESPAQLNMGQRLPQGFDVVSRRVLSLLTQQCVYDYSLE